MRPRIRAEFSAVLAAVILTAANLCGQLPTPEPVAFISQPLVPTSVAPGSGAFTLVVRGSGFTVDSIVHWNGNPRTTTFVSSSEVWADIDAADVASVGTAAVAVDNSGSSGATRSNIVYFPIANVHGVSLNGTNYAAQTGPLTIVAADFNNTANLI
jgi:hypothetical protein